MKKKLTKKTEGGLQNYRRPIPACMVPKDALDPRDRNKFYQTSLLCPVVNSAVVDSMRSERTPMCVFRPVDKEEDVAEY